jgi:hypothetical protein
VREIFINGVAFRYKSERDLSLILRHATRPARLRPLLRLCADVKRRRDIVQKFRQVG